MNTKKRSTLLLALALSGGPALADDDEITQLRHRVEQLEDMVRKLTADRQEQKSATAQTAPTPGGAAAPAAATPGQAAAGAPTPPAANGSAKTASGQNGNGTSAYLSSGEDIGLRVQLHGDLQADGRFYEGGRLPATGGRGTPDTFLLRRARPILEATVLDYVDFRVMPDFGSGTAVTYDAYAEARVAPEFKIRAGKYKPPLALEALQSDDLMFFSERSLVADLAPIRDVGLQVSGEAFGKRIQYAIGVFNGALDGTVGGDRATGSGKDVDARVFLTPFNGSSSVFKGLGFGVSYGFGRPLGSTTTSNLPAYLSNGQQTVFTYNSGAFADGSRHRMSPQAYWYVGPFGVTAEYIANDAAVTRGTNHRDLRNSAWEVSAGYVLTGEDNSYYGIVPEHPAWHGGWGAFEVVARTARLKLDTDAFAGAAAVRLADPTASAYEVTDYGIGINWFLTRLVRINLSYDKNTFKGLAGFNRPDEQVVIGRFQVAF